VLADLYQISGPGHPDTLRARWNVAAAYHKARRLPDAIDLGETALADCERFLGPGHWETLSTRANLAHAYHAAGKLKRSSAQFDRALRDCEQALGPDDPLTGEVRVLRNRYLAGRQGGAPIITAPAAWIRASQEAHDSAPADPGSWPAGPQL
jgi:tetratricopeptide (TPR) repeat protein